MIKKILFAALFLSAIVAAPLVALAQPKDVGNKGEADPAQRGFQLVSCTGVVDPRTGKGVECDYNQLVFTASRVVQFVLYIISFIVLGMIVYAGFKYVTSNGDAKKIGDAKKMFTPIFIGLFLILAAYVVVYKLILGNLLRDRIGDVNKTDILRTGGNQ